jgi:hypothetical protein
MKPLDKLSDWGLQSKQLSLLSGCEKLVFIHCGGASHCPNKRRVHRLKSQRSRSTDRFQNSCSQPSEKKMMVIPHDRLTPYQGTAQDEWP